MSLDYSAWGGTLRPTPILNWCFLRAVHGSEESSRRLSTSGQPGTYPEPPFCGAICRFGHPRECEVGLIQWAPGRCEAKGPFDAVGG